MSKIITDNSKTGKVRKTSVKVNGVDAYIVHDRFCADGPVDAKTGEPLIDPATGERYEGANDDLASDIHNYLVKLRSNKSNGGETISRFGVLGLLSMSTPIYCYDHPALKERCNTAFTDGISVFVDADFMRKLVNQEEDSDGKEFGVLWLMLHELMHKLSLHITRMRNMDPVIANIAQDLVINGKLIKGFPELKPVALLRDIGQGVNEQSAEKYYNMSEEVVAEMLILKKRQDEAKKKQQSGQGEGDGQGSSQTSGQKQQSGSGSKGQGAKGGGAGDVDDIDLSGDGEYGDRHHMTPEELISILEEEGLMDTVGEALGYPPSSDVEKLGKIKEKAVFDTVDAVQTAMAEASRCSSGYPGQHIAESAASMLEGMQKGKLTWKLGMKNVIQGEGMRLRKDDDEADIPWLLDKSTMGVDPWYQGALIPAAPNEVVLCLLDMSGSTGRGRMRVEFAEEAMSLSDGVSTLGDSARKVVIMSADTVIRGEPVVITKSNIDSLMRDGLPVFGDGGTSFVDCLREALEHPILKKEKIKYVVYFSDCEDHVPERKYFAEYLDKGIKIVFVTPPSCFNEEWSRRISWAETYVIEEGTVVNLDKTEEQHVANTRKNRM